MGDHGVHVQWSDVLFVAESDEVRSLGHESRAVK